MADKPGFLTDCETPEPDSSAKVRYYGGLVGAFLPFFIFVACVIFIALSGAPDERGFWPYGERDHHRFIDSFHTGYNLVSMETWMRSTGDFSWEPGVLRAMEAYSDTFWLADGTPKYYHDRLYPIDIHCSAQGILTFLRFKKIKPEYDKRAELVALWAIQNMQDERGYFHYQITRFYKNRIPYMRWAQAWMYLALSSYCQERELLGDTRDHIV